MKLNDKYKLEAVEPLNVTVSEKYYSKETEDKPSEEKWKAVSYHPNLEAAFRWVVDREINITGLKSFEDVIKKINELKEFKSEVFLK